MKSYAIYCTAQLLLFALSQAYGCSCWRCSPERAGRSPWSPSPALRNIVISVKLDIDLTYASPILAQDSTIFVCSLNGDIRAFQKVPSPTASGGDFWLSDLSTYSLVWHYSVFPSTPIIATPAIAAGDTPEQYTIVAAAGSEVVGIVGRAGSAAFAEQWRVDLCSRAKLQAAWAAQVGSSAACALRVDGSPAISHDSGTAFVCGYGGAGPQLGACTALSTRDGAEIWTSSINLAGFRCARSGMPPPLSHPLSPRVLYHHPRLLLCSSFLRCLPPRLEQISPICPGPRASRFIRNLFVFVLLICRRQVCPGPRANKSRHIGN